MNKSLLFLFLTLLQAGLLLCQSEPYYVTRVDNSSITFDGKVNEKGWADIDPFPLKMQIPILNAEPTEFSEIRLTYDDDYIYLSGILYDSEPSKIMANTKKRDAFTGATQWFGFVIDSYNDNENALAFFTTPTGIRFDLEISGDILATEPANISWNGFWDVKVSEFNDGWQAEIRVPFSTLAFEDKGNEVKMGIITWRSVARKNEVNMFPLIPPNFGDWSAFKPSLAQDVIFRNVKSKKPFYVAPYILSGFSNSNDLNEQETAYSNEKNLIKEIGADIKYGLSKNYTLDLGINTDFAQVEADDQQVNLTRFSLFFPEKRLFFQERAGIFNFDFGSGTQLFYSRRIGLNEDSEPTRIYGGARIVGRSGLWDFGLLSMETASEQGFDGENLSVIRAKRQIFNDNSDAGFMITNRLNWKGDYNTTYGIDMSLKLFLQDFLEVKWASTLSNEREKNNVFSLDPSRIWIALFTRRQKGFSYGTSYSRAGVEYNPSMGFEQRENYTRFGNRIEYGWFPPSGSFIFRHGVFSRGSAHWGNEGGKLQSLGWNIGWKMASKDAWNISFGIKPNIENLIEPFDLTDDITIPKGDYEFLSLEVEGTTAQTKTLWTSFGIELGEFYDGDRFSLNLNPTFNVSSSLELSTTYQYNQIKFDNRNQRTAIHLARVRALYMIDTRLSVASLLQYNSQMKNFSGNIRFRYNPSEGNDLFIVYNDDINTDLMRERPILPKFNQRSIVLKYTYTFQL